MEPVSIDMNYISTRLSYPAFWLARLFSFLGFPQRKQNKMKKCRFSLTTTKTV